MRAIQKIQMQTILFCFVLVFFVPTVVISVVFGVLNFVVHYA